MVHAQIVAGVTDNETSCVRAARVAFGLTNVGAHTTIVPVKFGAGLRIVSDDPGGGVTGEVWLQTSFDLKIPCLSVDRTPHDSWLAKISLEGRIDRMRVRINDLEVRLTDVHHAELVAGPAYLAYGVIGRYGTFR